MLNYNLNFLIASTVFVSLILLGLFNILIFLRKKFSVKVNCWFCNTNLRVPYVELNSFTCAKCQQYNGFNVDGSYNKEIPEQHYSKFNTNQFCQTNNVVWHSISNGFCEFCTRNQELKVHQLANFRPRCEGKFDEEIEEFRQKLEDSYQLCHSCQRHLNKTLNRIKTKFIGSKLSQFKAKTSKSLQQSAKIILDDGNFFSYLITSILLILSIANFIRDLRIELPTSNDKLLNVYNHIRVFIYTIGDIINNWIKLNDYFENIDMDKIATSGLILNLTLVKVFRKIRIPVVASMILWSVKMMLNEIPFDASHELIVNGIMAVFLIISSIFVLKDVKRHEFEGVAQNKSFHKIATESYEESDDDVDLSATSSFFDSRSSRTIYSNTPTSYQAAMSSKYNSSLRSTANSSIKNSTVRSSLVKPAEVLSNKSFSIAKEVLTADRNQVQNDIIRLKLSDKSDDLFSSSSTIKEFNHSQNSNPFSLERSRCDSPAPSVVSLFSTSTRTQLISPPRLHNSLAYKNGLNSNHGTPSWIAGGYWTVESPQKKNLTVIANPVMSRSSSQSSGLGTIDDSDKNSREDSMSQEDATSLFSDATNHRRSLFEMPQSRSLFTNTQFFNQQKNNNFFNNCYSNNSFRKYRESKTFFK